MVFFQSYFDCTNTRELATPSHVQLPWFQVTWAQRSDPKHDAKNIIFLNITINDDLGLHPVFELTSQSLYFSAVNEGNTKSFTLNLDFYDTIVPKLSKHSVNTKGITAILQKSSTQLEYWPRLTKEKGKLFYLKTDFDKWVDEDDQNGANLLDDQDFDFNNISSSTDGLEEVSNVFSGLGGAAGNKQLLEAFKTQQ